MDVKEFLKNYRIITVKISMARAVGKINGEMQKLINEKTLLDKAIDLLDAKELMVIDEHFRQGLSYDKIARGRGYAKSTMIKRSKRAINLLQNVF